ncbi:MAG: hypothetical protein K8H84_15125 [Sulfuricella denitrificans]|nr:hypothetical protein [Sulfuricella denitrificans]
MDWNWFFSSLSQSAAAIVGIFGAFIITKILSNQATFAEKNNRMRELMVLARKIVDDAGDLSIDWYNKRIAEREIDRLERLLEKHEGEPAEQLYDRLKFSVFIEKEIALQIIRNVIESRKQRLEREREEERRQLEEAQRKGRAFSALAGISAITSRVHDFKVPLDMSLGPALEKERETIDLVVRNARHHIRLVRDFLDSVQGNPESSPQITYALALITLLFFVGVIYPLSFMPTRIDTTPVLSVGAFFDIAFSLRGALLMAVSAIFTGVLGMFFAMNVRMKYGAEDIQKLVEFSSLGAYSKYFSVMEKNQKTGAAQVES